MLLGWSILRKGSMPDIRRQFRVCVSPAQTRIDNQMRKSYLHECGTASRSFHECMLAQMAIWCRENLIWMHETHNDDSHQHNAPPQSCQNVLHVGPTVSSIGIFSSRVEQNMKTSNWLGESVRTPSKLKCFKWHEEASSPSPTEGWRPMLGQVLRSPSRMSMHTNPTSCQKCRSTSHQSFVHHQRDYYLRKFFPSCKLQCWNVDSSQNRQLLVGLDASRHCTSTTSIYWTIFCLCLAQFCSFALLDFSGKSFLFQNLEAMPHAL